MCLKIWIVCCILDVLLQSKLDDYQVRKNNGERLNQDQLVGILKLSSFFTRAQIIL